MALHSKRFNQQQKIIEIREKRVKADVIMRLNDKQILLPFHSCNSRFIQTQAHLF